MIFGERPMHEPAPGSDAAASWSTLARHFVFAAAFQIALVLVCAGKACSQDEAFILRWMRTAAEHPVRTALAVVLTCEALRRARPSRVPAGAWRERVPW